MNVIIKNNLELILNNIVKKSNILIICNSEIVINFFINFKENFSIYCLTYKQLKNQNNLLFINTLKEINHIKFSLIVDIDNINDYYINNYKNLLNYNHLLLDEGKFVSLINSNINSKNFNKIFIDNYCFINIYPVNKLLCLVYFKKISSFLNINITLTDINSDQFELVNKIHDFFINSTNFLTIPNNNIINENITIDNNNIARGKNLAFLKIDENIELYLKKIGCKSRNMIKKCQKNEFYCKKINPDDYLDNIYEINTSKEIRQGKKMTNIYTEYPTKFNLNYKIYNQKYSVEFYGIFKDNKLVGYGMFYFCKEIVVLMKLLGHGDYLKFGIMNLLFFFIVNDCIENYKYAKYINYLTIIDDNSNSNFKLSVGFEKYKYIIVNKEL